MSVTMYGDMSELMYDDMSMMTYDDVTNDVCRHVNDATDQYIYLMPQEHW